MGASADHVQPLFSLLWNDYISFNPDAKRIYDLILAREKALDPSISGLANDHIAIRTFNLPGIDVAALGGLLVPYGYKPCGEYVFKDKKLFARHFEHDEPSNPKIFISELETEKLSADVQAMAKAAAHQCPPARDPGFFCSGRHWKADHRTYLRLLDESEYAAWMYAFGFRVNHFTVLFNYLRSFKNLEELGSFIRAQGFAMNTSGGEIKGTKEVGLEQSSTLASRTRVRFEDGEFEIPSTYYEFARRYPMNDGKLYQGFVTASADKIFESTNVKK